MHSEKISKITRRTFLQWVGAGGLVTTLAGLFGSTIRFLFPNVLYEPPTRFKVGFPTDFPMGVTFLENKKIFIAHAEDGFYAVSSVCTHLGCNVRRQGNGFECPCHGSRFDGQGNVLSGPAPRPLNWYALRVAHTGELIVDTQKMVDPGFRLKIV